MQNSIYIGTSIDGYIADRDGKLDFLESVPNPNNDDFGFALFMESVDALLMGRKTLETVLGFDVEWPYSKHVFVYSSSLKCVPEKLKGKVTIVKGELEEVITSLAIDGYKKLYIDGGQLIRSLLSEDKIDRMVIARLPVLLGGGIPLFGETRSQLDFQHIHTEVFLDSIVMTTYQRKR